MPIPSIEAPRNGSRRSQSIDAVHARFRIWRERTLPRAAYQIEPNFWLAQTLDRASDLTENERRMVKRGEPQITGLAYTARSLYLVVAAGAATYEHVAKLIHARALLRDDPDYAEHRGKRVSLILLADQVPAAIADFARRHRVRIMGGTATPTSQRTPERTPASQAPSRAPHGETSKPLCP